MAQGLCQGAIMPESSPDIIRAGSFYADTERQFGSRHHLCLDPASGRDSLEEILLGEMWREAMLR